MSEFTKATGEVDKVLTDYEDMMKKVQEVLKDKMLGIFKAFFDAHPEVKTIHWRQYTPYFNDGDECVFSVQEPYFTRTEYAELEGPHAWGEEDAGIIETRVWNKEKRRYVDADIDPTLVKDMQTMSRIIQAEANEAVMLAMFDNHVWVKAHRDGFEVEDFDHD